MHGLFVEWRAAPGGAERAIALGAAGPAGDLCQFRRIQMTKLVTVEFTLRCKCNVIDIEIEPHTDGVRGDEVVDVAGLVELDLGVPGAGRETAHHHGTAT